MPDDAEAAWLSDDAFWPAPDGVAVSDVPMLATLAAMAGRLGDQPAMEDDRRVLTFGAMQGLVGGVARAIRDSAAPPGPAAVLLPADATYFPAALACIAAGRLCVLLDAAVPPARNADLLRQTGAALLLEPPGGSGVEAPGVRRVQVDAEMRAGAPDAGLAMGLDDPAFILCTSGSTGTPKAIVHSQRTMVHRCWVHSSAVGIRPGDLCLAVSPPNTIGGFMAAVNAAMTGSAARFLNLREAGLAGLFDVLATRPVTLLRAGGAVLRTALALPGAARALAGLRNVTMYGEPVLRADVAALRACLAPGATIFAGYGSTEAAGMGWYPSGDDPYDAVRTPAGRLAPGVHGMIVDEADQPCGPGEAGELVIRSRYNALGEWQGGRCVLGPLRPDAADPTLRIHRTGDLARRTEDGVFLILGRMDRMLKANGQRIEPAEIEAAIRRAAGVADCAVVAQARGASLAIRAHVVLRPGVPAEALDGVRRHLRQVLPPAMMPSKLVAIPALPLLPGGKVDYVRLAAEPLGAQ